MQRQWDSRCHDIGDDPDESADGDTVRGLTWVRRALPEAAFPSDPGFMLLDAAGAPGRVMVVGVYGEAEQPAVWVSP